MSEFLQSDATLTPADSRLAALRRVSGAEVVDEGIQLARQNYAALAMAALLPMLPVLGMRIWTASQRAGVWSTLLLILYNSIWASLAGASAARVAMDALDGRSPDPARAVRIALRYSWLIVMAGLCRAILTFIGLVLLVLPGLYVLSAFALASVLPVLELSFDPWHALRRSVTLTRGARWLAFGAYGVPSIFVALGSGVLSILAARTLGRPGGLLLAAVVGVSALVASAPFLAAIQVRLYLELRMRKEAIDIEWALNASTSAVGE